MVFSGQTGGRSGVGRGVVKYAEMTPMSPSTNSGFSGGPLSKTMDLSRGKGKKRGPKKTLQVKKDNVLTPVYVFSPLPPFPNTLTISEEG